MWISEFTHDLKILPIKSRIDYDLLTYTDSEFIARKWVYADSAFRNIKFGSKILGPIILDCT